MRGRDRDRLFRVGFVRGENNSDLIWNEDRVKNASPALISAIQRRPVILGWSKIAGTLLLLLRLP